MSVATARRMMFAGLLGIALCIASLLVFGLQPKAAYQSQHIVTGNQCAVYVYNSNEFAVYLEDRSECGGFLAFVR